MATPGPITGTPTVCVGAVTALDNSTPGGTWSIVPASPFASIHVSTGLVTGVAAGTAEVTYTTPALETVTAVVTVNGLPAAYNVLGTTNLCSGPGCGNVSLSNSATGINYQLYKNGVAIGSPIAGTGISLPLATECATGRNTYTVSATNPTTGCSINMNGSAIISKSQSLTPVTADLQYCVTYAYSTNDFEPARIISATQTGIKYSLMRHVGITPSGSYTEMAVVYGTGGPVAFPYIFANNPMHFYKIVALDTIGGCSADVTGVVLTKSLSIPEITAIVGPLCVGYKQHTANMTSYTYWPGDDMGDPIVVTWSVTNPLLAHINTTGINDTFHADAAGNEGLVVSFSNGCADTAYYTINSSPNPGFAVNYSSQPLTGNSFAFTATVTPGTHTWAFGDATSGSGATPSHVYSSVGTYTVTHTLNNGSCAATSTQTVTVTEDALVSISGSRIGIDNICDLCVGDTTQLSHPTPGGTWSIDPATAATINSITGIVTGIAPGTGIVTYSVGASSVTVTVTVHPLPNAAFTVNDLTQELTGNNFVFTTVGSTSGNTYGWNFGDATTYSGTPASHVYTAVNLYDVVMSVTLTATGCTNSSMQTVSVLSDEVDGGGGDGGLESESLGGLVSQLDFNRIKNSVVKRTDYTKALVFTQATLDAPAAKGTGTQAAVSRLQRFVPASLNASTTAVITSPNDITKITKAVDVFALDYVAGTKPKAVVLGITTLGKPYTHTKSICDRFRGGTLIYTEPVKIKGYDFIRFALRQPNGGLEFCIAFDAGKSAGRNTFNLQTSWLINQYKGDDSVFNFQAWATDPENTVKLVTTILDNLAGVMPVQQVDTAFRVPPAYMAAGRRNKGSLDITITNNTPITSAELRFEERVNEFANVQDISLPVTLKTGKDNVISVPINDGYEYPGYLYLNGQLVDMVYMADGNWSLDYDESLTKVSKYSVVNDPSRIYVDNEYPLYRGLHVKANSADYMMAYKFITSGNEPVDLSGHRSLKFYAKGTGQMKVMLIKEGITKWAEQYSATITLDPAGKEYAVSFVDFVSTNNKAFKADDVTAVVFSMDFGSVKKDIEFQAARLAFSPDDAPSVKDLRSKSLTVSPNPSNGAIELKFQSETTAGYELVVVDVTGRVVHKQNITAAQGANSVKVTLPANLQRPAMYTLSMGNENTTYAAAKLSITE